MKSSVESNISFSLNSRRPEFTPSLLATYIESRGIGGSRDFTVQHDSFNFLASEPDREALAEERGLLQGRVRKFDIRPNTLWPVSSRLPGYRWCVFRDPAGRFYAFLFVSRVVEKILIKFFEKTKNAVSHSSQNPDRLQKKVEEMVFKFNDFSYKESISEFMRSSNFEFSDASSRKETCQTEDPQLFVHTNPPPPAKAQLLPQPPSAQPAKPSDFSREQRLMHVKLVFSFAVALSALLFILDLFWKLRRQIK